MDRTGQPAARSRAVFLDKDGTVIENVPYNVDPERIFPSQGALSALAGFHRAGYRLVVITNQPGVARGLFSEQALAGVERRLRALLGERGVPLAGFYYCPHGADAVAARYRLPCSCRKPQPGLIARAAADLYIDCAQSWMVGDILDDVEAGRRAGCRTVLLNNGNETEWRLTGARQPHRVATSWAEIARL